MSEVKPTLPAGRSLIILIGLPIGTVYDEDLVLHKEVMHNTLSAANIPLTRVTKGMHLSDECTLIWSYGHKSLLKTTTDQTKILNTSAKKCY